MDFATIFWGACLALVVFSPIFYIDGGIIKKFFFAILWACLLVIFYYAGWLGLIFGQFQNGVNAP